MKTKMKVFKYTLIIMILSHMASNSAGQYVDHMVLGMGSGSDSTAAMFTVGQSNLSKGTLNSGFENSVFLSLDTTFAYSIGDIPDMRINHNGKSRFRIYWDEHPEAKYTYYTENRYDTTLFLKQEVDAALFEYIPLKEDMYEFNVIFSAIHDGDIISQTVTFTPAPVLLPEYDVLTSIDQPELGTDTVLIDIAFVAGKTMNNQWFDSVATATAIGTTIVFENGAIFHDNNPFDYNIRFLSDLNLYASTIIVREEVNLPQTAVMLFCENLIFEDGTEKACFNTTPNKPQAGSMKMGMNASDFHCYFKNIRASGSESRFIMEGAQGSDASPSPLNWPGDGGNGGNFYSNQNINYLVENEGGLYGKVENWSTHPPSAGKGNDGHMIREAGLFKWLHANYVRFANQYARDHYILGNTELPLDICNKYIDEINLYKKSTEWANGALGYVDSVNCQDLDQLFFSFTSLKENLSNKLDYFGNPYEWAPLLSFEVNYQIYQEEMKYAISVFYLNYWLGNKAADDQRKRDAIIELKRLNIAEIDLLLEEYDKVYEDYFPAVSDYQKHVQQMHYLNSIMNTKVEELLQRARDKISSSKETKIRQALYCAGIFTYPIPLLSPALKASADLDFDNPVSMDNFSQLGAAVSSDMDDFNKLAGNIKGAATSGSIELGVLKLAGTECLRLLKNAKDELAAVPKSVDRLKSLQYPQDKIMAEFNRLKAECPLIGSLSNSISSESQRVGESYRKLSFLRSRLLHIPAEVTKLMLAIDAADDMLLRDDFIVDQRALSYLDEMEKTAWERMLKYHYYMARAYQYRFLKPYDTPLDTEPLFDEFKTLAGDSVTLSSTDFKDLLPVLENQLKGISDEIFSTYNTASYPEEWTKQTTYTLTPEQLRELNKEEELIINLWESGKIALKNTDSRISDVRIDEDYFEIHQDTILPDAYLEILFAHSGNSVLIQPESGKHLYFSQYKKDVEKYYQTSNMSPLGWGATYHFLDESLKPIERGVASSSLIRTLLPSSATNQDIFLFTRPAAWGDLKIILDPEVAEQVNMNYSINNLRLKISSDNKPVDPDLSNVLVNVADSLLPLITCSKKDVNNRNHGWGGFTRTYRKSDGIIYFTAPENYGVFTFDYWLRTTNNKTDTVDFIRTMVNTSSHTWITAKYALNVPELDVPDTIYTDMNSTSFTIGIKNLNPCEHLKMEWFSHTDCDWFSIDEETSTGLEDGTLKVIISENNDHVERIGTFKVYALEAYNPEQEVVVIQKGYKTHIQEAMFSGIIVYPVPAHDEVHISFSDKQANKECHIRIHSLDGKLLYDSGRINSEGTHTVKVNNLADGIYVLSLDMDQRTMYSKIVVN